MSLPTGAAAPRLPPGNHRYGIVPARGPLLDRGASRSRSEHTGGRREYLRPIPVYIIGAGEAALRGLARPLAHDEAPASRGTATPRPRGHGPCTWTP